MKAVCSHAEGEKMTTKAEGRQDGRSRPASIMAGRQFAHQDQEGLLPVEMLKMKIALDELLKIKG